MFFLAARTQSWATKPQHQYVVTSLKTAFDRHCIIATSACHCRVKSIFRFTDDQQPIPVIGE